MAGKEIQMMFLIRLSGSYQERGPEYNAGDKFFEKERCCFQYGKAFCFFKNEPGQYVVSGFIGFSFVMF